MFKVGDIVSFKDIPHRIKSTFLCDGESRYIISTLDGRNEIISLSRKSLVLDKSYQRRKKLNKILSKI